MSTTNTGTPAPDNRLELAKTLLAALDVYSQASDLARARRKFAGLSSAGMEAPYGDSGQTPAEILHSLAAHQDRVNAARAWIGATLVPEAGPLV